MDTEIWKRIPQFEDYEVSNHAQVRSLKFGKIRMLKIDVTGKLMLIKDGKKYKVTASRLAYCAFHNMPYHLLKGFIVLQNGNTVDTYKIVSQVNFRLANIVRTRQEKYDRMEILIKDAVSFLNKILKYYADGDMTEIINIVYSQQSKIMPYIYPHFSQNKNNALEIWYTVAEKALQYIKDRRLIITNLEGFLKSLVREYRHEKNKREMHERAFQYESYYY